MQLMSTDEQLALAARAGDEHAAELLLRDYEPFIRWIAAGYFDATGDTDDLLQEARLAVVKAIRDYDPVHGSSFKSFLSLVVKRHLIAHVIGTNRQKQRLLSFAVREAVNEDGDAVGATDLAEAPNSDPHVALILSEQLAAVIRVFTQELSPHQRAVVTAYVNDESYQAIAKRLGLKHTNEYANNRTRSKAVDNALQLSRRKVLRALAALEEPRPLGAAA